MTVTGLSVRKDHATTRTECVEKYVAYFGTESLLPNDMVIRRGIKG